MRQISIGLIPGAIAAALGACTGARPAVAPPSASAPSPAVTRPPAVIRPPATPAPSSCPVTLPEPFVPPSGTRSDALFGAGSSHGNGKLWVGGLGDGGVIDGRRFVEPDGSIGMKFGWWRAVPGRLTITGRRLDGAAAPLWANVPAGYGDIGFQSTGVYFTTAGCWEVVGRVGGTTLTFVTFVTK